MSEDDEPSVFDTLPNEVLCKIITNLGITDRARASKVSKRFYTVAHNNLPIHEHEVFYITEEDMYPDNPRSEQPDIKLDNFDYLKNLLTMVKFRDFIRIFYNTDKFAKRVVEELSKSRQSFKAIALDALWCVSEDVISFYYQSFATPPSLELYHWGKTKAKLLSIPNLSRITDLTLHQCPLGSNVAFPSALSSLKIIATDGDDVGNYLRSMASLHQLKNLRLHYFTFFKGQENYHQFVNVLSSLQILESLDLKFCFFPTKSRDVIDLKTTHLKHLTMEFCGGSHFLLESLISSSKCLKSLKWTMDFEKEELLTLTKVIPILSKKDVEVSLRFNHSRNIMGRISPDAFFLEGANLPRELGECMKQFTSFYRLMQNFINKFIEADAFRNCEHIVLGYAGFDDNDLNNIISSCRGRLKSIRITKTNITEAGIANLITEFESFDSNELNIEWYIDYEDLSANHINRLYTLLSTNGNFPRTHKVEIIHKVETLSSPRMRARILIHCANGRRVVVRNYDICDLSNTGSVVIKT